MDHTGEVETVAQAIPVGTEHEIRETVTPEMGVSNLGPAAAVISTPSMFGLMEQCCLQEMWPYLDPNENSVCTKF